MPVVWRDEVDLRVSKSESESGFCNNELRDAFRARFVDDGGRRMFSTKMS